MFDPAADAPAPSALPSRPGRERDVLARVSEDERLAVLADVPPGGLLASALEGILEAAIPHPDVDTFHPAAGPDGDLTSTEALSADERALLQHSRLAPGEPLAAVDNLARLGLETLSELVAACQRLTSWSDWVQSLLAAAMTRRVEHLPSGGRETADRPDLRPGSPLRQEEAELTAASEIACRLGISRRRAAQLVDRGQALCLPALSRTAGLHRSGLIDATKTALVAGRLGHVSHEVAVQVQDQVLPRAAHRTHAQLARDLDRALAAQDPEGACQRRRRNAESRYVSRPQPAGEGVSQIRMLLPTLDAVLVDATLDAIAVSARATGDDRSVSQLRADAVVSTMLALLRREQHEACRSIVSQSQSQSQPRSSLGLPDDAASSCVTSTSPDAPADAPASAPVLADGVPLLPLLSGLSTLVSSTSPWWMPSGTAPVALPSGLQVQVDVTVPIDYLAEESFPLTCTDAACTAPACTTPTCHEQARTDLPRPRSSDPSVRLGRQSLPVLAAVATALASGGTWRRLLTDPFSGAVLDVGRQRYRPPAALAEAVRARDHTCTHPGCTVPARRCDLDHVVPWSMGGSTSLDNLTLLCETHHRLKHTPGWSLTRSDDGSLTWRTPSGARYRRDPDGSIIMLPRRIGPRSILQDAEPVPEHLAAAVNESVVAQICRGLSQTAPVADSARLLPGQHAPQPQIQPQTQEQPQPQIQWQSQPQTQAQWQTRGPRPGVRVGAWSGTSYPAELRELGLDVFLDEVVPF